MLKLGTTRIVWLIGNYAIKFPRIYHKFKGHRWKMFLRGILANLDENFWWKCAYKKDKLCPVKFMFPLGLILVMKRAEPLTENEYNSLNINEFKDLPMDNKIINFGKIEGRVVLIDYADSKYLCSDCSNCWKNR